MFAGNVSSSFCEVTTNSLIFPQAQHWNMDTGGLCSPTILPEGDATLYLGSHLDHPNIQYRADIYRRRELHILSMTERDAP